MKIGIIGGGYAGVIAALFINSKVNEICIFEKNKKIGMKLGITGKGRGNLTNTKSGAEFLEKVVTNKNAFKKIYYQYTNFDTIEWFKKNGLPLKEERGGRIFPESDKALDVVRFLKRQLKKNKIKIVYENVNSVIKVEEQFEVLTKSNKQSFDKIVVATGGLSYPLTGSTGDGYDIGKSFGHHIIPPVPALVELYVQPSSLFIKEEVKLKNVRVKLMHHTKKKLEEVGEIFLNGRILSGPLSLKISSLLRKNITEYSVIIDLKPGSSFESLQNKIISSIENNLSSTNTLRKILHKSLVNPVIEELNLDEKINKKQVNHIVDFLKNLRFPLQSKGHFKKAIITQGGIDMKEIETKTLESKKVKGLFFAGEVLDIDAFTGGYNLQIAFSTAVVVAKKINDN